MKTGIIWSQVLPSITECAMTCAQDFRCLSFTYDSNSKDCQGHDNNFNTQQALATAITETKQGSTYFFQTFTDLK